MPGDFRRESLYCLFGTGAPARGAGSHELCGLADGERAAAARHLIRGKQIRPPSRRKRRLGGLDTQEQDRNGRTRPVLM
jgi:hypothetical protein